MKAIYSRTLISQLYLSLNMQAKKLTLQRLMKQEAGLDRQPLSNAIVTRKGLLKFHFCLYNLQGPYTGGFYHGVLELHENYPFAAPKLIFYTQSGRFEINLPVCTSFTNYHQESWTSAWNVRTLILATVSFMYSEEPSYGCRTDSNDERIRMARNSLELNMRNPQFLQLFGDKLKQMGLSPDSLKKKDRALQVQKEQGRLNYTSYVVEKESIDLNQKLNESDLDHNEPQELIEIEPPKPYNRNNRQLLKAITKGVCCVLAVGIVFFVAYKIQ